MSLGPRACCCWSTTAPSTDRWGSKTAYSQLRLDSLPAESAAELLADSRPRPRTRAAHADAGQARNRSSWRRRCAPCEDRRARGRAWSVPADTTGGDAAGADDGADDSSGGVSTGCRRREQLLQAASVSQGVSYALLVCDREQPEADAAGGLAHLQEAEFLYETQLSRTWHTLQARLTTR